MATKEKSFTIRLPEDLVDQIDMRCHINYRSRTKEIQALLVFAIDTIVAEHGATSAETPKSDQSQKTA